MLERSVVHSVRVLNALVLLLGGKALPLHTCAVQDVTTSQDLRCESLRLAEKLAGSNELLSDLRWQSQSLGGDQLNLDVVMSQ
jgi:hypothetical protein